MAGFRNISEYARGQADDGKISEFTVRKLPSQSNGVGNWMDLSMTSGTPVPNYYAASPLVAAVLDPFKGMFHGDNKAPEKKYLTRITLSTIFSQFALLTYTIQDYVLFYPFIDGDSLDEQVMDNTVTLPRYEDGVGLVPMMVILAPTTGAGTFTFNYVNQDDVEVTSGVHFTNASALTISTISTSQHANTSGGLPYLRLNSGDTGIKRITSVTFSVGSGGLHALVLVKPLYTGALREAGTPTEVEFIRESFNLPEIKDGAYLNMICCASGGSLAGAILSAYGKITWR